MIAEGAGKPVEILLVEDNPGDVRLVLETFRSAGISNPVRHVSDGEEALRYLRREEPYGEAERPGLVLLDLNLPKKDGREVLAEAKGDPELKTIPILVLTTSRSEADILKSYSLHANAYIAKPVDVEEFLRVVRTLGEFWLSIVSLPRRG